MKWPTFEYMLPRFELVIGHIVTFLKCQDYEMCINVMHHIILLYLYCNFQDTRMVQIHGSFSVLLPNPYYDLR